MTLFVFESQKHTQREKEREKKGRERETERESIPIYCFTVQMCIMARAVWRSNLGEQCGSPM